jgi:ubiquinone/menaquinone biosynthesis C-methylase UbiE
MLAKDFYDKFSEDYDTKRFRKRYSRKIDIMEKKFIVQRVKEKKAILEIGAGTGRFTVILVDMCERIVAVDISAKMLDVLRTKIKSPKVEVINVDLFSLQNLSHYGKFDAVICMRTLPHLGNVEEAIRVLYGAVSNEGNLIFDLWCKNSFVYLARRLLGRRAQGYTNYVSYGFMKRIIDEGGLKIIDSLAWGFPRIFSLSLDKIGNRYFKQYGYSILFNCVKRV